MVQRTAATSGADCRWAVTRTSVTGPRQSEVDAVGSGRAAFDERSLRAATLESMFVDELTDLVKVGRQAVIRIDIQ